jgi:uncharacterized membrane protein
LDDDLPVVEHQAEVVAGSGVYDHRNDLFVRKLCHHGCAHLSERVRG